MQFLRVCFCCTVLEGYGMTETSCTITLTRADDATIGHVRGGGRNGGETRGRGRGGEGEGEELLLRVPAVCLLACLLAAGALHAAAAALEVRKRPPEPVVAHPLRPAAHATTHTPSHHTIIINNNRSARRCRAARSSSSTSPRCPTRAPTGRTRGELRRRGLLEMRGGGAGGGG